MGPVLIALAFARALDAASTCAAFAHGGVREANPFLPASCGAAITVQAGLTVGQIVLLRSLAREHPRAARVIGWVTVGVEAAATGHNVVVLVHLP